jgi:hypothetical protein
VHTWGAIFRKYGREILQKRLWDFFDDLTKSTLLVGGNSKSYGNFEF